MAITVRFRECQRYDINQDCDTILFMAMTSLGSYWTEIPIDGPTKLRRDRDRFKEMAVQYIQAGQIPCRIDLPSMDEH